MGRMNLRSLVDRLQRVGTASRAELAKSLNMSAPTAGKITEALLRHGVVEEVRAGETLLRSRATPDGASTRRGRPGRMLRLDRSTARFIGIELGASHTCLGPFAVGVGSDERWPYRFETPASAGEWVCRLKEAASLSNVPDHWGVLVSVPGIVDEQAGTVIFSPNLHWTEQISLPELIRGVWDVPVTLVQEERALALGHQQSDPDGGDFLLIDVGEGVGSAAIVSGRLYVTPQSISGELGHTPVLGNSRRCGCGAIGCVETLLSTSGLLRSFAEARGGSEATWQELLDHVTARGVDPWLCVTLDAAAAMIAGALNILGLRRVVVTGRVVELAPTVIDYLTVAILKGAMWARFGRVTVEAAPRRRKAGLAAVGIERLVLPRIILNPNSPRGRTSRSV
jgi:predicted NBD/HSP70 family sugar kinase